MRKHLVRFTLFLVCLAIGLGFVYSQGYLSVAVNFMTETFSHKSTGRFSSETVMEDFLYLSDYNNSGKFGRWEQLPNFMVAETVPIDSEDQKHVISYSYQLSKFTGRWQITTSVRYKSKSGPHSYSFSSTDSNLDGEVDLGFAQEKSDLSKFQENFDSALDYLHKLQQGY